MSMTYQQIEQAVHDLAARLAHQWFTTQARYPGLNLYLFYRKPTNGEEIGDVRIWPTEPAAPHNDHQWTLVSPKPVPAGSTAEQARAFILDALWQTPILSAGSTGSPEDVDPADLRPDLF